MDETAARRRRTRRWLLVIALAALAIRITAIVWTGAASSSFGDAADYRWSASQLCTAGIYPDHGNSPFFRAPGLPFFIAFATACHPERIAAIKVALAVCDAVTCVLIGEIALLLSASVGACLIASSVAAFDPFFVTAVCDVRSEPLFMLLLTAAILLVLRASLTDDIRPRLGAGFAFGLAALTRPAALALLAFAVVAAFLSRASAAVRWRSALAIAAGGAIALAPWVVRNALRYHEAVIVNDAAGYNFWRGNHPAYRELAGLPDRTAADRAAELFEQTFTTALARDLDSHPAKPHERSNAYFRRGLQTYREAPDASVLFAIEKAWWFWRPWLSPQQYGARAVVASGAFNLSLYTLPSSASFNARTGDRTWRSGSSRSSSWRASSMFRIRSSCVSVSRSPILC